MQDAKVVNGNTIVAVMDADEVHRLETIAGRDGSVDKVIGKCLSIGLDVLETQLDTD